MTEKEYLKSLTRGEKRYLAKYECGWCEKSLAQLGCGSIYGCPECTEESRVANRKKCLKGYKPRNRA